MMVVEKKTRKNTFANSLQLLLDNRYFLISLLLLVVGMLVGSVAVGKFGGSENALLSSEFKSFIEFRTSASILQVFFSCFLNSLVFATVVFVSSIGVLGLPLIPVTLFFKGLGTAAFSGLLYRNYHLTGVAFSNLVLMPPSVMTCFILVYLSADCFELSLKFTLLLKDTSSKGVLVRPTLVVCFRKYLICVLLLTVSSAAEALLSAGFIRFFEF